MPPSPPHNFHPSYRPDIDGLRAVAILGVVAYHAFPAQFSGGFVGVDVFFVISGFLISTIIFRSLLADDFSFLDFYVHRVRRIFPALILVMTACFFFGWFVLFPDEYKQLGKHIASGAGFVQNFILWNEAGYFDVASEQKPLMHLWSLSIEEQFYIVFPLLMWLGWRLRLGFLPIVGTLAALSFGANLIGIGDDPVQTFFVPQTRVWELLAGALLAGLTLTKTLASAPAPAGAPRAGAALSLIGLLLILSGVFLLDKTMPYPGTRALIPVLGTLLLIAAGSTSPVNRRLLSNRAMVFVGTISYPLYLWHWPLLSFARVLTSEAPGLPIRLGAVACSFLLAYLTCRLVENPFRYGGHGKKKALVLCLLLTLIGFIGYNDYVRDGLSFRHKQLLINNAQLNFRTIAATDETRCLKQFPDFKGYCLLAKDGAPTVAIVGDSLTTALFGSVEEAASGDAAINPLGLSLGGMLPLKGVTSYDSKSPLKRRSDSAAATEQMISMAGETASVHLVVLVGNWPRYVDPHPAQEVFVRLADRPDIEDNAEAFRIALARTFEYLTGKGKQVIFVLNHASLGFDPQSCLNNRRINLGTGARSVCAIPRADFEAHNRPYREIVAAVAQGFPAVQVFDAAKPLCDENWCWGMKDATLLYADPTHLSPAGSRQVARFIVPLIRGEIARAAERKP